MIQFKLDFIRKFQDAVDGSHVGGSIGLLLHGLDLKRKWSRSDIDLTVPSILENPPLKDCTETGSHTGDFDYCYESLIEEKEGYWNKIEVRVDDKMPFVEVEFNGHRYRVTAKEEIIKWKNKYASLGVYKHIEDLKMLGLPIPDIEIPNTTSASDDDLPF